MLFTEELLPQVVNLPSDHGECVLEHEGIKVYPLRLTPESLAKLYSLSRPHPTLLGEWIRTPIDFAKLWVTELADGTLDPKCLVWVVDEYVGIFYLTDIQAGIDALCHYCFFDSRTKGRADLTRNMLRYVFQEYQFHRLTIEVPLFAHAAFPFVESLGFIREGRKRHCRYYKGEWFDVNIYGMLADEVK
jgi:RimJ/RimL family protein N-acetyltransferase